MLHMPKIMKDILSRVGYGGTKEMEDDVQNLVEILRAQLTNKRYLIIIDDLWSTRDWHTIECAFVENNNGSRVITTTRIQDVAIACCYPSQGHVFQMQLLNELHSSTLFFKRLFGTQDGCPEQLRKISNDMLRKCKGVPLAITSIASLLANQSMHVETWEKIRNSMGSGLDTNPTMEWMSHVLSLSYNDLSHELKTCLLYLGVYPEDHAIGKFDLVRKWIAEGFVRERHGLDLEEAAENCFNELINRSMIKPFFNAHGEVQGCQVHDLMLDLIISKCKKENFMTIIDRNFAMIGALQVRRISHQFHNRDIALVIERVTQSQVRSCKFFSAADCMPLLSKFELLRVLDMDGPGSYVRPEYMCLDLTAINHLFLLRYLKVSYFRLVLPKKFGKLKHLTTLDIESTILCPWDQFSDFTSLSSLRHLILPSQFGDVVRINGLSKLCNLRTLINFRIRPSLIRTSLMTAPPSTHFWSNFIRRPQHLQRLRLGRHIPKVPNCIVHAHRLAYLEGLLVQELRSDGIQVLAQLPCLIYLDLGAITIPEKNIIIHPNTFPSLKHFIFNVSCELSFLTFEPSAMPRLQILRIDLDGHEESTMQLQEDSPVGGIENLASLEKIFQED
ncbi:hypothetical protein PVAP13_9NG085700 [Panicum virgatum]|uniref:NB-ARC domain-containing protein n=1 Tax=Panicum virgatum TaxID=38727 RepID=A0A8T0MIR6_PANVG|nr:hypothetical protein PVAP13_9NG085700 [Panicum virgatum]